MFKILEPLHEKLAELGAVQTSREQEFQEMLLQEDWRFSDLKQVKKDINAATTKVNHFLAVCKTAI